MAFVLYVILLLYNQTTYHAYHNMHQLKVLFIIVLLRNQMIYHTNCNMQQLKQYTIKYTNDK